MAFNWSGIPNVYITLADSERSAQTDDNLRSIGVLEPRRLTVQRHPKGSVIGIFRSHTQALRKLAEDATESPLYAVFEDDAVPAPGYFSHQRMQKVANELYKHHEDFDMGYLGCITWHPLALALPYGPSWHRVTPHVIDHAWNMMHAIVYTQRGLRNVLPLLEEKLALMENGTGAVEHVDIYIEMKLKQLVRRQVLPYIVDQNWTVTSENTEQCAPGVGGSSEEHRLACVWDGSAHEMALRLRGNHLWWSNVAYEIGVDPVRFYIVLGLLILQGVLVVGFLAWCMHAQYVRMRADRRGASESTPLKSG